jgi:hypothetical protein
MAKQVWATPPDRVEDAEISNDEGELYLVITGDFVRTFEKYLADDEAISMAFKISPELADGLCASLYEIKHG